MYPDRLDHSGRSFRYAALAVTTILVIACSGQSRSAPSSTPTPNPTAILVSPSASAIVPTASPAPPTATPAPTASPRPTPTPITSGLWVSAGRVSQDIYRGELVALPDGGAMLVGIATDDQMDETVSRMATEVWLPGHGWRQTTPLPKMRSSFASVALEDGRVLVAGGYNEKDASYSSSFIFDRVTETWSKTGLMTVARTHPGAALLRDGRVLLVGGYFYAPEAGSIGDGIVLARSSTYDVDVPPIGRALATAEVFDPTTGEWTPTGSMRYARSGPEVVTLTDGRVLVVGSSPDDVRADERAHDTAEIYDPATGRFTAAGTLPDIDYTAISRLGVKLPLSAPTPGVVGSLVSLRDGGAVLIGNEGWWKHQAEVVRSFRFDPGDKTWRDIGRTYAAVHEPVESATTTVSRVDAAVASLKDGSVFVSGGYVGGRATRHVERYDPLVGEWSRLPNTPQARSSATGVALADGSVMLVGGWSDHWQRTTYRFVPRG
jgi:Kelch motif protein/galactose oxidase-like protein